MPLAFTTLRASAMICVASARLNGFDGLSARAEPAKPRAATVAANPSAAVVKVNEDGTATLLTGTVETGQGSLTILAQIAAQELGIATEDVHVVSADTDATPMDTGAIASRTTYVTGNATKMAAEKAKQTLFEVAAPLLGVKPTQLEAADHKIFVKGFPQRNMHIGDVANHARVVSGQPPIGSASFNPETLALDPETGQGKPFGTYVYATQIAEVDVDDETGEVEVVPSDKSHSAGPAPTATPWPASGIDPDQPSRAISGPAHTQRWRAPAAAGGLSLVERWALR